MLQATLGGKQFSAAQIYDGKVGDEVGTAYAESMAEHLALNSSERASGPRVTLFQPHFHLILIVWLSCLRSVFVIKMEAVP
jgi:hypothetical protein